MTRGRAGSRPASVLLAAARIAAGVVVLGRFLRGARRLPPVTPRPSDEPPGPVSVVIPARDEEARLGRVLAALRHDPQVHEVLVVDDESTDGTADLARALGARVVPGAPLPPGWVGKPWALQQGLQAAEGEWVLCLDADTEPLPGLVAAAVAAAQQHRHDLLTLGARFVCDTPGQRFLHPAMLTTLLYRFGPPGRRSLPPPHRVVANGQCLLARRQPLLAAGGFALAAANLTDDVALARRLAALGWRVGFLDGTRAVEVRMHDTAAQVWRNWGRSLPMPDTTSLRWQALDLATVWLTQGLPLIRLLAGRADRIDAALLGLRLAALLAQSGAYRSRGPLYWLSPLADPAVSVRLTTATVRPGRTWRGRTYPARGGLDAAAPPTTPSRSAAR